MNDRHDPRPTAAARALARASRARASAVLAVATMLAACSAVPNVAPTYREPPKGLAAAKVRVVNLHPQAYYADIAVFDSPACFTKADRKSVV